MLLTRISQFTPWPRELGYSRKRINPLTSVVFGSARDIG
jgi:hypothetical protein